MLVSHIVPVVFTLIAVLGVVGNSLVLLVVLYGKQMRNTTNILILVSICSKKCPSKRPPNFEQLDSCLFLPANITTNYKGFHSCILATERTDIEQVY